jgi:hypothetical protein
MTEVATGFWRILLLKLHSTHALQLMGWKALFDENNIRYKLRFDGQMLLNEKMLKNCEVRLTNEGTLDKLMKAINYQWKFCSKKSC